MKTVAMWAGVACCLCALPADGQQLRLPASATMDADVYSYYYRYEDEVAQPSPSDLPVAPPVESPYLDVGEDLLTDHRGKHIGWGGKERRRTNWLGDRWILDGFVDFGGTVNPDNPSSRFNGPMTFNDRDDFMMNQLYLSLGRQVDRRGCGFDWGARVDFLYGTDYIFTQSIGLETKDNGDNAWNGLTTGLGNPDLYGLAMPQAYVDLAYNRLNFRLGHFYTIMGYESVPANRNFFYSHAYTRQYGEPFTHTGGLLTWSGDRLTTHAGLVNGWDKTDAVTDKATFLGGVTYRPEDDRYSLSLSVIAGEENGALPSATPPATSPRHAYSLVLDYHLTSRLDYVFQHDYGRQHDASAPNVDAEWYGINQYLFYTLNDCWKVGARFEWFRDDDGTRLSAAPVRVGGPGGLGIMLPGGPADLAGNYYSVTLGANWTPRTSIVLRPEVRWDWSDGTAAAPYDNFTKDSQFTAALDAIVTF